MERFLDRCFADLWGDSTSRADCRLHTQKFKPVSGAKKIAESSIKSLIYKLSRHRTLSFLAVLSINFKTQSL